ncbi:MAG: CRTAC1 family protein [Acidobacteriota bacterium]
MTAQTSFTEVAAASGIDDVYELSRRGFGGGVAAADFDDDGDVDLFFATDDDVPHLLYRNLGDGTFEEIAATLGLDQLERGRSALWFDADGDGRLDLAIGRDCYDVECDGVETFLRLYRQQADGQFVDVTVASGLISPGHTAEQHRSGLAAGDVNGDGHLDLVSAFWKGRLRYFENQGDGTFVDASAAVGISDEVIAFHQPVVQDLDGDGRQDIYSTVDFTENRLWLNRGYTVEGTAILQERGAAASCDNAMNDMGIALGDPDGDGDLDFYVTNIFRNGFHNVLLQNDLSINGFYYSEISSAAGVQNGGWGWGTSFFDVDNDLDLDLAETNGWNTNTWDFPPRFFVHQGTSSPTYVDQAPTFGLTDISWGSSLVAFDADLDGDVDMVETIAESAATGPRNLIRLHRNELSGVGTTNHYLNVRPRMGGPNARAIGARVQVEVNGETLTRWIHAGTSYLGQEPAEAFFGLNDSQIVDAVTVFWPGLSGQAVKVTRWSDVDADQILILDDSAIFTNGFESGDTGAWTETVP